MRVLRRVACSDAGPAERRCRVWPATPAEKEANMYRNSRLVLALAVLGMAGCTESSTSPRSPFHPTSPKFAKSDGTGLVLDNVTGITLPLIGQVGDVVVQQTNLTHLVLV